MNGKHLPQTQVRKHNSELKSQARQGRSTFSIPWAASDFHELSRWQGHGKSRAASREKKENHVEY